MIIKNLENIFYVNIYLKKCVRIFFFLLLQEANKNY